MDVSPGHVPSCWELCPFPGRSPSHAGLCLISDTDSRQRNRDPGSLPRLGAPLQGHPFPQLPGGSARLASQFSSSLCPVPTSLIHSVCAQLLRCIQLIVTLWTVAHQAPLPMGFSRQEYWSGLHFLLQLLQRAPPRNPNQPPAHTISSHCLHPGNLCQLLDHELPRAGLSQLHQRPLVNTF